MAGIINELRYKIHNWLFMKGFLREVIAHYDNGKMVREYAFGFSLRRKWRESKEGQ